MGSLFAKPPPPQKPAPMPDAESPDVIEARRKAQQEVLSRGGRTSTILTGAKDRGGDQPTYIATKLGSGA